MEMTVNEEQSTTSTSSTVCQGQDSALLMKGQADDENDEDEDGDDFMFLKLASLMREYWLKSDFTLKLKRVHYLFIYLYCNNKQQ